MAIKRVNKVEEGRIAKKFKKHFAAEVVMLVVGAEDGVQLVHNTSDGAMTITGENTVRDLRAIGVDVEDWVDRKIIAPLGVLAVPVAPELRKEALFEKGEDPDGEDIEGFETDEELDEIANLFSEEEDDEDEEVNEEESDESDEEESEDEEEEEVAPKPVAVRGRARGGRNA